MGGVVLEHVDHVVEGDEGVVDCHDLGSLGHGRAENQATNAAESVDTDLEYNRPLNNTWSYNR